MGRMREHIRQIKIVVETAGKITAFLLTAVFFSLTISVAGEPETTTFESQVNQMVLDLSRSIVTVEAAQQIPLGKLGQATDAALESYISTGVICDSMGNILVSAPTIIGRDQIRIQFEGLELQANLVAIDYENELALLNCGTSLGSPANISKTHACAGQMVVGLGNSFGIRSAPTLGFCAGLRPDGMMQFTMPVSSSSVGGGVFDLSGQLVGVVTGRMGDGNQLAVGVPGYRLPGIIHQLLTEGDRESGFLGITSQDIEVTPPLQFSSNTLQANTEGDRNLIVERGVLVASVLPGSPAQKSGLRVGDLVFSVDNISVNSAAGLARFVRQSQPGATLQFRLIRNHAPILVNVVLGKKHILPHRTGNAIIAQTVGTDKASLQQLLQELRRQIIEIEQRLNEIE